jgi:D-alanine transaminase
MNDPLSPAPFAPFHSQPDPLVYLSVNGQAEMLPLSEARIPVLDRGFIFGDGIYEVVPVYERLPFRLDQHLQRMTRSLAAVRITNPYDAAGWKARIAALILSFDADDQFIYMQITRGVAKRGHAFPQDAVPTVFMMTSPLVLPTAEARAKGVAVVSAADNRWLRCDIKSVSLLGNVLMAQHALEQGVTETILFRDGFLTEGSSTNVWVVKDGVLLAPPRDNRILEGIRYGFLMELAAAQGVPVEARPVSAEEVRTADELLLSSATKEVLPVTQLDGAAVGHGALAGQPGPVYQKLYAAYQAVKQNAQLQPRPADHAA